MLSLAQLVVSKPIWEGCTNLGLLFDTLRWVTDQDISHNLGLTVDDLQALFDHGGQFDVLIGGAIYEDALAFPHIGRECSWNGC